MAIDAPNNATSRPALSDAKRALLEKRMQGKKATAAPPRQIPVRPEEAYTPLSYAQQRMWFLNQLEPDSAT